MLHVSVLLTDHHPAQNIYMCELIIINLPEVEEFSHVMPKLRIFGAVHILPRVLSRCKLGKRNIYFSPNNFQHGQVTLLF